MRIDCRWSCLLLLLLLLLLHVAASGRSVPCFVFTATSSTRFFTGGQIMRISWRCC